MMKWPLILLLMLVLALSISADDYSSVTDIGNLTHVSDTIDYNKDKNNSMLSYKEQKKLVLVSIEDVKYIESYVVEKCRTGSYKDKSGKNITGEICINVTKTRWAKNNSQKPKKEYRETATEKISYEGKDYKFDHKGCWVCGQQIVCLDKGHGWSENRGEMYKCDANNKPIVRVGECGYIDDLKTGKRIKVFGTCPAVIIG